MSNNPRQNVYGQDGELAGWFDRKAAACWEEETRWDGNNHISVNTNSQWAHERLYRSVGGKWVLYSWSQWQGSGESWRFVSDKRAKTWLLVNEHDDAVEEFFGPLPDECDLREAEVK